MGKISLTECQSVIEGIKKIYKHKILPLEKYSKFHEFVAAPLADPDFDSKPMVLLLGQYSVGKTTFIEYLLQTKFLGSNIGPEPTTDRFCAVMYGEEPRIIPGYTLSVLGDKPFRGLAKFGTGFLSKFQSSECPAPILQSVTFIDTPGVLAGEKQSLGRLYDFTKVSEWFAERSDLILLLFDAHKLDISDEFRHVIESLKHHDDKIRVILNKSDTITPQQLIRVFGALMWSMGKILKTPEVVRVYVGSFWNEPYLYKENENLFEAEKSNLIKDLTALPANSIARRVNELVKRARFVKVHALVMHHLRKETSSWFWNETKRNKLLHDLDQVYAQIKRETSLSPGDFPDIKMYREILAHENFTSFPLVDRNLIRELDLALERDLPKLLHRLPWKLPVPKNTVVLENASHGHDGESIFTPKSKL